MVAITNDGYTTAGCELKNNCCLITDTMFNEPNRLSSHSIFVFHRQNLFQEARLISQLKWLR